MTVQRSFAGVPQLLRARLEVLRPHAPFLAALMLLAAFGAAGLVAVSASSDGSPALTVRVAADDVESVTMGAAGAVAASGGSVDTVRFREGLRGASGLVTGSVPRASVEALVERFVSDGYVRAFTLELPGASTEVGLTEQLRQREEEVEAARTALLSELRAGASTAGVLAAADKMRDVEALRADAEDLRAAARSGSSTVEVSVEVRPPLRLRPLLAVPLMLLGVVAVLVAYRSRVRPSAPRGLAPPPDL